MMVGFGTIARQLQLQSEALARIEQQLARILAGQIQQGEKIMVDITAIRQAVAEEKTVIGSVGVLLSQLTAKIQSLIDAGASPAEFQAALDEIKSNTAELQADVVTNTP